MQALVGAAALAALSNWASHGEVTDAVAASVPSQLSHEQIGAINNDHSITWRAGVNERFSSATLLDAKRLMGVKQSDDAMDILPYKSTRSIGDVPSEFDWRIDPRAANCPTVKEIRDQSNCGSCWAFGSVEAMSDRTCILSNATATPHLSAQDVTSCDKLGNMGCSGGIPSQAYMYVASLPHS
jgi:cathepsin B